MKTMGKILFVSSLALGGCLASAKKRCSENRLQGAISEWTKGCDTIVDPAVRQACSYLVKQMKEAAMSICMMAETETVFDCVEKSGNFSCTPRK